ncbi:putative deoxyribonuclease TATDN1 [Portunus trituberculatus]|uniref:Putative deoxyribonuclease TATDN1 n=1 Tax=Portunus trituberculatus TaxID=210409 RepID=A0A5B7HVT8_PORTR|nr:putative deoxyribonuclease TATDN1 [Portunus trituberculatus]
MDIGANLTDEMYQGIYHGNKKHEADLSHVLKRAWEAGLNKMIITGTSLSDSKAALELAKTNVSGEYNTPQSPHYYKLQQP